ncbi:MAG: GNAT family N-acetyltransferase [Steroidobacteraceae bacterium]
MCRVEIRGREVSHTPARRFNRRPIAKAKKLLFHAAMNLPSAARIHVAVHDNPQRHRFEAEVEGRMSFAEYELGRGTITFTHTLVPESQRGRGIATQLVQAALTAAQAQHRGVIPQCSMFSRYMRRRPETQALLAPAGRAYLHM